ncbi:metal ABC transporter solute-binding protein, Zn/Mn family [Microbacterium deminutum]|uniref:Zinc ABC transporter substrate-binding protein n=1 Tax=Microbacterium deminutum TaxID=344164 RepID=A0ABP5C136_9MICO
MPRLRRPLAAMAMPIAMTLAAASALLFSGCAATDTADAAGDRISVVASTSVYGQIAEAVGGTAVDVTSIVSSASQDPHSFEPSAQDQLAVRHADLVIENGAGYDAFMAALVQASGSTAPVITAVASSPEWSAGGSAVHFNEHVWYDPQTMGVVASAIAAELSRIMPARAATFAQNAKALHGEIDGLETRISAIRNSHAGEQIFVTEPVPLYLTAAAGLENVTPAAFTEAVEEGHDVAPATLLGALTLLRSGDVRVLIANSQTGGAETMLVIHEAQSRSIPVLEFAETLPHGKTYISWMRSNIDALSEGLGG